MGGWKLPLYRNMARLKFFILQLHTVQVTPLIIQKNVPLTKLVYFSERERWGWKYLQLLKWYFCDSNFKGTNRPRGRLKEAGRFTHSISCITVTLVHSPHPKVALERLRTD